MKRYSKSDPLEEWTITISNGTPIRISKGRESSPRGKNPTSKLTEGTPPAERHNFCVLRSSSSRAKQLNEKKHQILESTRCFTLGHDSLRNIIHQCGQGNSGACLRFLVNNTTKGSRTLPCCSGPSNSLHRQGRSCILFLCVALDWVHLQQAYQRLSHQTAVHRNRTVAF